MVTLSFFFNDTATTEIYTLSLHDALPILKSAARRDLIGRSLPLFHSPLSRKPSRFRGIRARTFCPRSFMRDRKSTRLNSSHANISYAVFCLKKTNTRLAERKIIYIIVYDQ